MIVRAVTIVAASALLVGCGAEGMRAQELLQQAEAAQEQLRSSTFDGSMSIAVAEMNVQLLFNGSTSADGAWFSMRTSGVPNGGDGAMQVLIRGGRAWTDAGNGWTQAGAAPTGSRGTVSADAVQQLARYVKDVRVTEHQLIDGEPVTTIAGEIDTQGMLEAIAKLGSFAPSGSFDFSGAGIDLGDIEAVLTIDERTRLLETAFVTFSMSAEGKRAEIEIRYRLTSANEPVELPRP